MSPEQASERATLRARVLARIQAFERGAPLPEKRAALLFDLGGRPAAVSAEALPDDATICHCNGVSKGELRECVAGGGGTLQDVMRATRSGGRKNPWVARTRAFGRTADLMADSVARAPIRNFGSVPATSFSRSAAVSPSIRVSGRAPARGTARTVVRTPDPSSATNGSGPSPSSFRNFRSPLSSRPVIRPA